MTQTALRIALAELNTVRVTCRTCQFVSEFSANGLPTLSKMISCPHCGTRWPNFSGESPFLKLHRALHDLSHANDEIGVEFTIPIHDGEK